MADRMKPEEFREAQQFLGLSDRGMADRIGLKSSQTVRRYKSDVTYRYHRRIPGRAAETVRGMVADELEKL